jgi:molybdopterin-guanine dinucleotide biosynthesis protein A
MNSNRPAGVVLTGGASKRMGVDKATFVVDGKPMAVRVADALWEAGCHPVECQGGNADAIVRYGLEVVADREPGRGPVVAIHQALARHPACDVVVAACDLVDLDGDTVGELVAAGTVDDTREVVVASTGAERHLVSWWRRGSMVRLGELIAGGVTSYREALTQLATVDIEVAGTAMHNVNSPTDLQGRG